MKKSILCLMALVTFAFSACQKAKEFDESGALVPKTVVEDPSLPSIKINGVQLHAQTFGNPIDPILIVLHGGPGGDYRSLLNYQQVAQDSLFVVFYDQRGAGLSERIDEDSYDNVQDFINELEGVIQYYQQHASQPVILAGHSWGAMLATAYINQNPTKITGAILSEPGGFTWEQTEAYSVRSNTLNLFGEATNDVVFTDQIITGSSHNTLDYKMALSLAGTPQTGDAQAPPYWRYGAVCNKASIQLAMDHPEQMNFTTQLNQYKPKVLFAYSQLNTAYGLAHAQKVSSAYANVDLVEIAHCGHEIPAYGWSTFYPNIKKYINEIL